MSRGDEIRRRARLDRHALSASGLVQGGGLRLPGLLRGSGARCLGEEPEAVPAYSMDWSEPAGRRAICGARRRGILRAKPLSEEAPGDVLLFRMRDGAVAKHLGIGWAGRRAGRFIHAYSGMGWSKAR